MFVLKIDLIINKVQNTVDSFSQFENIKIKSNNWYKLRDLSIDKLEKNEDIDNNWIMLAKMINEKSLPLEACIIFSKHINTLEEAIDIDIDYINNKIIDILYSKIEFNLSGPVLITYIKQIGESINDKNKISLLIRKFNNLIRIKLNYYVDVLVGIKINNFNKVEVVNYIPKLENYFYIIDEDINFFNFYNGENISELKREKNILDKENNIESLIDYEHYFQVKEIEINNDYERMLIYEVAKEIYEKKVAINNESKISKVILDNIDLFSDNYKKKIYKLINYDVRSHINKSLDKLRYNPNNETLKDLIKKSSETEEIFTIIKFSESLSYKFSLENYVDAICKCYYLEKSNSINDANKRKIALFCEELIADKPIVFTEVINILKEMYSENIFTDKTIDTLKYIKHTVKDEKIIDEIILKFKYKNNKFDNDFVETICIMEKESGRKTNILDELLNKFIYNVDDFEQYDNRIIGCIYGFYKRNNDRKALHKLCEYAYKNRLDLKSLNIDNKDIYGLIKMYDNYNKEHSLDFKLKIINEFKEDEKILNYGKVLLEKIYSKNNISMVHIVNNKYSELFKILRKSSTKLFELYIKTLESSHNKQLTDLNENKLDKDDIEEMIIILNKNNVLKTTKIYILNILIKHFINDNNTKEMILYMQIYINKYSDVDKGELFKRIIYNNTDNIEFLEDLLYYTDFNSINNAELFLKIMADNLYKARKVSFLSEILRYFVDNKKYEESVDILKKYITSSYKVGNILKINNFEIDEIIYETIIEPILSNVDLLSKKEIYEILITRSDLIMKIRDKYFYLCPSEENKNYLIEDFINKKGESLKAKQYAAELYFDDDEKFNQIINTDKRSSKKICELAYKKSFIHFNHNKEYVYKLLENIYESDNRLFELFKYCQSYEDTCFNLEEKIIFESYKCIKREKGYGKCADKLYLTNVFDKDDNVEGVTFVDEENILYDIITEYLKKLEVNYTVIDGSVVLINEKHDIEFMSDTGNINKFIEKFKLLIRLQLDLIKNNKLMIEFFDGSVVINEKGFIPCSFNYICNYQPEFKIKSTAMFKAIPEINIGNYAKINEENICRLILKFTQNYLNTVYEKYNTNPVIKKFIENVLNDNDVVTYETLLLKLDIFLDAESKTFEEIDYKIKLQMFNDLEEFEQVCVVEEIISKKDTTLVVKKIMIYYEGSIFNTDDHISYLIECFNNSILDLDEDDVMHIYERVNKYIFDMEKDKINSIKNELYNFYINAKDLCKIHSEDLRCDIENLKLDKEDKDYLLSRV